MSVTPSQIVRHLQTYLPLFTSAFTETLTITGAVMGASNTMTVTATGHGLSPGDSIVLTNGTTRNPLTGAVLDGDNVIFETGYDHDVTAPQLFDDPDTLTLGGFGGVWDGEHDIVDVTNRQHFTLALPTGETLAPVLGGSEYLIDSIPLGAFTVITTPTADTFTIVFSDVAEQPQGTVDGLEVITGFRIYAAADYERAKAAYTKQSGAKLCLFVIMTDTDVSKDPHTLNDAIAGFTAQDERLLKILQNFSTSVFIPTTGDLSGADAQDLAYGTLNTALLSALFNTTIATDSLIPYVTVPAGNGPGEYNTAFYTHVYDWQLPSVINYADGFNQVPESAFRDIAQTLDLMGDDQAQLTQNVDLDDDPIIPT